MICYVVSYNYKLNFEISTIMLYYWFRDSIPLGIYSKRHSPSHCKMRLQLHLRGGLFQQFRAYDLHILLHDLFRAGQQGRIIQGQSLRGVSGVDNMQGSIAMTEGVATLVVQSVPVDWRGKPAGELAFGRTCTCWGEEERWVIRG